MTHENPVLAEVIRSGFAESAHRGAIVVTGPDGAAAHQGGAVDVPMFPRSARWALTKRPAPTGPSSTSWPARPSTAAGGWLAR
jgi:L-asparaginase II